MPAVTAINQYRPDEKDALEQWADEVGITMTDLVDQILGPIDAELARRTSIRSAAANGSNVVPLDRSR